MKNNRFITKGVGARINQFYSWLIQLNLRICQCVC